MPNLEPARPVKVYAFEEIDHTLKLLPLAARRALDAARIKVSLLRWQELGLAERTELVEFGSAPSVDSEAVRNWALGLGNLTEALDALAEPSASQIPVEVLEVVSVERPLPLASWAALEPLDRYALTKVAKRGRAQRWRAAYDEIVGASGLSSHLGRRGEVRMVDVSAKQATRRRALAESSVSMNAAAFAALSAGHTDKGDVLATARIAGIMAAKHTSDIIPLCHPLSLTHCEVSLELEPEQQRVKIRASTEVIDRTGVEMEAMLAAAAAALTVYDMLKGIDRAMLVGPIRLLAKSGGKSGDFKA